jgi:hypothetical protein
MINEELANKIIDYLNELTKLDKPAMGALISNRVPCNQQFADHPTCQCSSQNDGFYVGLLGILNGLCGIYDDGPLKGAGPIAAKFEQLPDDDKRYRSLIGFQLNKPNTGDIET